MAGKLTFADEIMALNRVFRAILIVSILINPAGLQAFQYLLRKLKILLFLRPQLFRGVIRPNGNMEFFALSIGKTGVFIFHDY
jgi:hypothetical protein